MKQSNDSINTGKGLWAKLYRNYLDDPDLMEAGIEAELLFVRSLAWAKDENTGFIHRGSLIRLGLGLSNPNQSAEALVACGIWSVTDNGWLLSNWSEYQFDSADVDKKREAGKKGNHERWHKTKPDPECILCRTSIAPATVCDDVCDRKSIQEIEQEKEIEIDISLTHAPDGFDEFWSVYPRKVGIGDARKAWKQTVKVRPDVSVLVASVEMAKAGWLDPKFIPYPASWLRGHRWADNAVQPSEVVRSLLEPCRGCIGTGRQDYGSEVGKEPCRDCGGSGKVEK